MKKNLTTHLSTADKPNYRLPLYIGLSVILAFFGGFGIWANVTKLSTAAVANGQITVDSNRKTVQHLEGGIVKKLFVREGSVVKAGEPLLKLDDTKARAQLQAVIAQLKPLQAKQARLIAQRDNASKINFPKSLTAQINNAEINKIITGELAIFKANKDNLTSTVAILNQRIAQLKSERNSLSSQVKALATQLELIEHEISVTRPLVKQKFVAEKQLWTLKREAARLLGSKNQHSGQIAKTKQRIGETRMQIVNFKEQHQQEVLTELRTTQKEIALAKEELKQAGDILTRTLITAPKAGTVVDLKAHTLGGIIQSAQPILDILPINDALVIEARINPTDIDMIHVGLPTKIQLVAYNMRNTPPVDGTLTHVSADVFTDPNSGSTFYKARIAIEPEQLAKLKNISLYPGMPVQVMIVTESRSFANYLMTPIVSSLQRAFTEQ